MAVTDKISQLVQNQFPDFYKEEGPKFLAFVQAYYAWMEENGNLTDGIRNLESYRDINTTTDQFIEYFFNTLLPSVPIDIVADKKLLAKRISEFNQSRGALTSMKFLFRALYNEEIDVSFPSDYVLKVSDGDWRIDRYLVANYNPDIYNFIGKTIEGSNSGSLALVEDVVSKIAKGRHLMQILVSNVRGKFDHREPIKLQTDVDSTGLVVNIDAGINRVEIISPGGGYDPGDILKIQSDLIGDFAEVVVTGVQDLGNVLTFDLINGGSGYTATTNSGGSSVILTGVDDYVSKADFEIFEDDIIDTFRIAMYRPLMNEFTIYNVNAPAIAENPGDDPAVMETFADVIIGAPEYGFADEHADNPDYIDTPHDYREYNKSLLVINNTDTIPLNAKLYGATSSANGEVVLVIDSTLGAVRAFVDGYGDFQVGETINLTTADNTVVGDVGTVTSFSGNTITRQQFSFGIYGGESVQVGDEIKGETSGTYGVIRQVLDTEVNGYSVGGDTRDLVTIYVAANNNAQLTDQFDAPVLQTPTTWTTTPYGGLEVETGVAGWLDNEELYVIKRNEIDANINVGTTAVSGTGTGNTSYTNAFTSIGDAIYSHTELFGTIGRLSSIDGGAGYFDAPDVRVVETDIAALGIGEAYIVLESDDANWGTGLGDKINITTDDKILQTSTGVEAFVIGSDIKNEPPVRSQYANGTYFTTLRVWQAFNQREPNGINWDPSDEDVVVQHYTSGLNFFGEIDERDPPTEGSAKIKSVIDAGVLGKNAVIEAATGAQGTITGLRVLDSGFSFKQGEEALLEKTDRPLATNAKIKVTLGGVANSAGYYATDRGHLSTLRSVIQDGEYYQEFSYDLITAVSIDRYRDVILSLAHPAGEKLFGTYRNVTNGELTIAEDSSSNTSILKVIDDADPSVSIHRPQISGTISITPSSNTWNITGVSTTFTDQVANGDMVIIEQEMATGINKFRPAYINKVTDNTTANLQVAWTYGDVSGANVYYGNTDTTHTITAVTDLLVDDDILFVRIGDEYNNLVINTIDSSTTATLDGLWVGSNTSSVTANGYYYSETF